MKINFIKSCLVAAFPLLMAAGCSKKFEDYSQNKNLPVHVPPGLVLRSILNSLVVFPGDYQDKANQFFVSNYTYYGDNKYWTGSATLNYSDLNNVLSMEAEARRTAGSDHNPYHALGFFLRAWFFVSMSEKVGDVPMTEALKGTENPAPKYDAQKDIYRQSLAWLDSANVMLTDFISNGFLEFSGDWYYQETAGFSDATGRNALIEWQKAVNSFRLRLLLSLSKRADDAAELNIKGQFADIVGNPEKYPIFGSNDDNLQYVYNNTYNYYPDNPNNYGNNAGRLNLAATLETTLGQLHDLRAMVFGEPARGLGHSDTSYASFVGAPSGGDMSLLSTLSGAGQVCLYNYNHFYTTFTAEPTLILSYAEACFNIAEGINRGWTTGNAADWYEKGIRAMFGFYGIKDGVNTVIFRNAGGTGNLSYNVSFSFSDYLAQAAVAYKGDNANGLAQILTQKYLGFARNSGLQAYYQWRRTGIPAFNTGTGTGNSGKIPLRFQYPTNENVANGDNLDAALKSQYGGADDINAKMWLIK